MNLISHIISKCKLQFGSLAKFYRNLMRGSSTLGAAQYGLHFDKPRTNEKTSDSCNVNLPIKIVKINFLYTLKFLL